MTLNFNPEGKKTILSIDGGGMRGVIPVKMLAYLEEQTGKPAYELFDLVAGTSTGAIIAAGLGLGLTAQQMLEAVYRDRLPRSFGETKGCAFWFRFVVRNRLRYMYPMTPFLNAMAEFTQRKRIRDMDKCIVLLTAKDLRTSNTYYIVNHGPGAAAFADWPISGAVAASGAVPVYFPAVLGNLVDGGVGVHTNPSLAATIEAVEYIGFDPANILHISLGTGFRATDRKEGEGSKMNPIDWMQYALDEILDDAKLQTVYNTRAIYGPQGMDFRRYNPDLARSNVERVLMVDTGGFNSEKLGLDSTDPKAIAIMEAIGLAYAQHIDWSKPNQMPWETVGGHAQPRIEPVNWRDSLYESYARHNG
jgi:uncharacterized protein